MDAVAAAVDLLYGEAGEGVGVEAVVVRPVVLEFFVFVVIGVGLLPGVGEGFCGGFAGVEVAQVEGEEAAGDLGAWVCVGDAGDAVDGIEGVAEVGGEEPERGW